MNGERLKGKESIGESKKEAWLSAKEVKKFVAEWRNNLTKWIKPCSFGNFPNFPIVLRSRPDEKHLFLLVYQAQNLPLLLLY